MSSQRNAIFNQAPSSSRVHIQSVCVCVVVVEVDDFERAEKHGG
ncbi:MAG: hypothetical protein ACE361_23595 [Aureliella sp.]